MHKNVKLSDVYAHTNVMDKGAANWKIVKG